MKLHLLDGTKITITRHNCGHLYYYGEYLNQKGECTSQRIEWNIFPLEILLKSKYSHDSYVIGKFGATLIYELEFIIPVKSVVYVSDLSEWETTEENYRWKYKNRIEKSAILFFFWLFFYFLRTYKK